MEVTVNNPKKGAVPVILLKKLAKAVSRKKTLVSLTFIGKKNMEQLNGRYRKKRKPTDVLSFEMNEGGLLGDVFICPEVARSNAKKFGTTYKDEVVRLAVHGMLHLLGYDHGKKMFDLQDKIIGGVSNA